MKAGAYQSAAAWQPPTSQPEARSASQSGAGERRMAVEKPCSFGYMAEIAVCFARPFGFPVCGIVARRGW